MNNDAIITIFTATYNRCELLERCYESMLAQTVKNFIWLIVDDGSTDDTKSQVKKWQKYNKINIKYIKQNNQGKHIAHNIAVANCHTECMLILDSDDILDPHCIEILNRYTLAIKNKKNISGVIGNRHNVSGTRTPFNKLPTKVRYATGIELYQKYNVIGDTLRLYKTEVLRKYLFPQIEGEKFIYENVVFDAIDEKYSMLIIHDTLYYCEYLNDGYTFNSSSIKVNNPIGYSMSLNSSIKNSINLKKRVNWTILYIIWCKKYGIQNCYKHFGKKCLYISLYPAAAILFIFKMPSFFFMIMEHEDTK